MIRVVLPAHLRTLAHAAHEVQLEIAVPPTLGAVLDAIEDHYPVLRGTIRDHITKKRRPYVRFFACQEDLSHEPYEMLLPAPVSSGDEALYIVGAIAGGLGDASHPAAFALIPDSIERASQRIYAAFCWFAFAAFAAALLWADLRKALWFDEIISLTLAHVSPSRLWTALTSGTDNNPPLFYVFADPLTRVIHSSELAIRLASNAALLLAAWCLYRMARRYVSRPFALAAGFLPLYTFFVSYAVEGRPYALAVAFTALSLLLWQIAISDPRKNKHLVALAIAVGCALSSHFSAALLVAGLIAGEIVRTLQRRKIDWPVLISITVGCLPLLLFLPILRGLHQITAAGAFWAIPTVHSVWVQTREAVVNRRFLIGLLAAAILLRRGKAPREIVSKVPLPFLAACIVLLCAPALGYLQSRFTGAFTMRYAMTMVIPLALALAFACDRISRSSSLAAITVILISTAAGIQSLRKAVAEHLNPYPIYEQTLAAKAPAGQPLVIGTPLLYLPLTHYAPSSLRPRLVYLADKQLALQDSGTNTPDLNLMHLASYGSLQVLSYRSYIEAEKPFLVLMRKTDHFTWLGKQLERDRVPFQELACSPIGCLYQVW